MGRRATSSCDVTQRYMTSRDVTSNTPSTVLHFPRFSMPFTINLVLDWCNAVNGKIYLGKNTYVPISPKMRPVKFQHNCTSIFKANKNLQVGNGSCLGGGVHSLSAILVLTVIFLPPPPGLHIWWLYTLSDKQMMGNLWPKYKKTGDLS